MIQKKVSQLVKLCKFCVNGPLLFTNMLKWDGWWLLFLARMNILKNSPQLPVLNLPQYGSVFKLAAMEMVLNRHPITPRNCGV